MGKRSRRKARDGDLLTILRSGICVKCLKRPRLRTPFTTPPRSIWCGPCIGHAVAVQRARPPKQVVWTRDELQALYVALVRLEFVDMSVTTDRDDPRLKNIGPDGMQEAYFVLSEEERAKGFVRPVRTAYRHVGSPGPKYPLRDLTPEEHERYFETYGYVKREDYPEDPESSVTGRYWTQEKLGGTGCGSVTTMGLALAETYAREPSFYGATFCAHCGTHLRVGEDGEFVWIESDGSDGPRVGT